MVNHAGLWSRRLWFESGQGYSHPLANFTTPPNCSYATNVPPCLMTSRSLRPSSFGPLKRVQIPKNGRTGTGSRMTASKRYIVVDEIRYTVEGCCRCPCYDSGDGEWGDACKHPRLFFASVYCNLRKFYIYVPHIPYRGERKTPKRQPK